MTTERLDVRLDKEHKRKLAELAEKDRATISEVIRKMIDRTYETEMTEWRVQLAREIAEFEIEDVPEPDELSRQMNTKYDFSELH